jgi:hypothetical protein
VRAVWRFYRINSSARVHSNGSGHSVKHKGTPNGRVFEADLDDDDFRVLLLVAIDGDDIVERGNGRETNSITH